MKTTCARLLAFVAATRSFAEARADTATDTPFGMLGSGGGLNSVQLHHVLRSSAVLRTRL
jgi:hypothetical protein